MSTTRAFMRSTRGALGLTVAHFFIGAVSVGIAFFRGTEVNAGFHYESTLAQANYGASKLAEDHARSANVVVNDNTIMGAIMGPRFAVEADNITMDANAAIACPTCPTSPICKVCIQYKANKPRALLKLVWVRAKQMLLWGTLGKLSGDIDKLAFQQASSLIKGDVSKVDSQIKIRFADPSESGDIWGGTNTDVACDLSMKDTLPSPMTGHAFPILITPNLLEGLPKILVKAMPKIICKVAGALKNAAAGGGGGGGGGDDIKLGEIKEVADQAKKKCADLEESMRCSVAAAAGNGGSCGGDPVEAEITDLSGTAGRVQIPSAAREFVTCGSASASSPLQQSGGGYFYRGGGGGLTTCTFDRAKCTDKTLGETSESFLREKVGLPKIVSNLAASLGGDETRKPSQGSTNPENFCACAYTEKQVDPTMVKISDSVRYISSFGQSQPSDALRKRREYRSCGRWYFPKRNGEFAGVPDDETPFVGAWKWNQTAKCQGVD